MKIRNASRWNCPLAVIAWAAFVISFFLPSYAEGRGYQCAVMHSVFWSGAMQGNWGSIHYLLLTLPNLLMLASPFLLLRFGEYVRCLSWLRYSTFAASILVWLFLILLLADVGGSDLRIGAYVWASSFVFLLLSLILLPSSAIETRTLKHGTLCA
jgi:hypothetical protein